MQLTKDDYIRTIQTGEKAGALIKKDRYEEIKDFFLRVLDRENPVTMVNLLDKGHERFGHLLKSETAWYLYNVKLDMEARGLINHIAPDKKRKRAMISKSLSLQNRYADTLLNTERKSELKKNVSEKFVELFGKTPLMIHAPGRINMIGEHTDYNDGFVMPAAIDKGIHFAIATSSAETQIYSIKYKQFLMVDLQNVQRAKDSEWQNYLLGIVHKLQKKGYVIRPFSCVFDGDLPSGAGLSSSAAMECGFVMALNKLFNLQISDWELITIAQWAEHNFVGVQCGIMDQFASVMSKANNVAELDCRSLDYKYHPLQLGGYCLMLCDTQVKHSLATSEYNVRRQECEKGVRILRSIYPKVKSLRDVKPEMLAACQEIMPVTIFKRCRYIVEENARVLAASKDLQKGDLKAFGTKMYKTHEGLKNLYEVSCAELDFLVDFAKKYPGIAGSRMMGGGFGGCTLSIIEDAVVERFIDEARTAYKQKFNRDLAYHLVKTANGARVNEDEQS